MSFGNLQKVLARLQQNPAWQVVQDLGRVQAYWPRLVGPKGAQRSRPASIKNDVLWVSTASAAWSQNLSLQRITLLSQLNKSLGLKLTDIRFSAGRWQEPGTPARPSTTTIHPCRSVHRDTKQSESAITNSKPQPGNPVAPTVPKDPQAAFALWQQRMEARNQSFVPCPRCGYPAPPGEIHHWRECSLCLKKTNS